MAVEIDESIDYDSYLQQMLYYIASCKSKPVHIAGIRNAFGIDDSTISEASQGLVHSDAIVIALNGALQQLNSAVDVLDDSRSGESGQAEAGRPGHQRAGCHRSGGMSPGCRRTVVARGFAEKGAAPAQAVFQRQGRH